MPKAQNTPRRNPLAAMSDDLDLVYGRGANPAGVENGQTTKEIAVAAIHPNPFQPRRKFDEGSLAELAESLKQQGVIQPLVVTFREDKVYCVAGERRLRAATLAGLTVVPCIVRENVSDDDLADLALAENIQRQDLTVLEEARAIQAVMTRKQCSGRDAAAWLHMKPATVFNRLALLTYPEITAAVEDGRLEHSKASAIAQFITRAENKDLRDEVLRQLASGQELTEEQIAHASGKRVNAEAPSTLSPSPVRSQTESGTNSDRSAAPPIPDTAEPQEGSRSDSTIARHPQDKQLLSMSPRVDTLRASRTPATDAGSAEGNRDLAREGNEQVKHLQGIQKWLTAQDWAAKTSAADLQACLSALQQIGQQITEAVEVIQQRVASNPGG